jgi:hypothetical protein
MGATVKNVILGALARANAPFLALALTLAATPSFAGWQEQASRADVVRLAQLPQIRAAALADAQRGAGRGDTRAIGAVMNPEGRAIPANALVGTWRCRQLKLGRMSSYMVYDGWFSCSIRRHNGGLVLQKMNGTQRFMGTLYPENGAWVYLGAWSAKGEPWHDYSGASASVGAAVTPDDQIGLLTGIGDNHLRLEIPAVQESLLDVVEFKK